MYQLDLVLLETNLNAHEDDEPDEVFERYSLSVNYDPQAHLEEIQYVIKQASFFKKSGLTTSIPFYSSNSLTEARIFVPEGYKNDVKRIIIENNNKLLNISEIKTLEELTNKTQEPTVGEKRKKERKDSSAGKKKTTLNFDWLKNVNKPTITNNPAKDNHHLQPSYTVPNFLNEKETSHFQFKDTFPNFLLAGNSVSLVNNMQKNKADKQPVNKNSPHSVSLNKNIKTFLAIERMNKIKTINLNPKESDINQSIHILEETLATSKINDLFSFSSNETNTWQWDPLLSKKKEDFPSGKISIIQLYIVPFIHYLLIKAYLTVSQLEKAEFSMAQWNNWEEEKLKPFPKFQGELKTAAEEAIKATQTIQEVQYNNAEEECVQKYSFGYSS